MAKPFFLLSTVVEIVDPSSIPIPVFLHHGASKSQPNLLVKFDVHIRVRVRRIASIIKVNFPVSSWGNLMQYSNARPIPPMTHLICVSYHQATCYLVNYCIFDLLNLSSESIDLILPNCTSSCVTQFFRAQSQGEVISLLHWLILDTFKSLRLRAATVVQI